MTEETRAHFIRDHQALAIAFMVAVGLGVWGIFFWRAHSTSTTTSRLCGAIKVLIQPTVVNAHTPKTPEYKYYLKHQKSLKALDEFYHSLPC